MARMRKTVDLIGTTYYVLIGRKRSRDRYEPLILDFNGNDMERAVATKNLGTMSETIEPMRRMREELLDRGWKDVIIAQFRGIE